MSTKNTYLKVAVFWTYVDFVATYGHIDASSLFFLGKKISFCFCFTFKHVTQCGAKIYQIIKE